MLALCIIAILAAIAVRVVWVSWASGNDALQWEGEIQPVTHDAIYHGAAILHHSGERLDGVQLLPDLLSRQGILHPLGVGARFVLPVSIASILIWAPILLSGLLAIPVLLICRSLGSTWWGFGAALLAVTAVNYFERTSAGYYDHDMISFTWATMIAWLLIEADRRESSSWLLAGSLAVFLQPFMYVSGTSIAIAIAVCWLLIRLIRHARSNFTRLALIIVGLGAALAPLSHGTRIATSPWAWGLALVAIIVAWWILRNRRLPVSFVAAVCGIGLVLAFLVFPWADLWNLVRSYAGIGASIIDQGPFSEISFRDPHSASILETQQVPLGELASRLIGSSIAAIVAIVGYVLACTRRPVLLVLFPMVVVGLFSLSGGLRFITWGTVPAAIGASWLAFVVARWACSGLSTKSARSAATTCFGLLLVAAMAVPSVVHDVSLRMRTVFLNEDIKALKATRKFSNPGDLVLGWWDHGTGIWYYANRDVLVHPGFTTDDLFPISRMLVSGSQPGAAHLGLALADARPVGRRPVIHTVFMEADPGGSPMEIIQRVESGAWPSPTWSGQTFLYIPLQVIGMLETISSFSHPDIIAGRQPTPIFSRLLWGLDGQVDGWHVHPPSGLAFDSTARVGLADPGGGVQPVRFATTTVVEILPDGRTRLQRIQPVDEGPWASIGSGGDISIIADEPSGDQRLHLLILPQPDAMLVVNDDALQSNAIQMGVLGSYDPELFDPVFIGPMARVYRIRPAN